MFGLGKPEDEERMRDRNSINGVKMGGVCEGLYAAKRCNNYGYEESYSSYNNNDDSNVAIVHVADGSAVNIFVNGQFVYGPIIGCADITIK